jgi:pantoate--beta-alanine ligase
MEVIRDRAAMRRRAAELATAGMRVGFVPTMGALHAGHLSLLERARPGCACVVASVFVNPLQFGAGEDFERYPRDLGRDLEMLAAASCDLVFAPTAADMYADEACTVVEVVGLQDVLCGATRPGHFRGVATVVAKLFHLVRPAVAVFGQKDAQQAILLRRMVRDLDWPVELRIAPIMRDADGLALSSRNAYLDAGARQEALLLAAALRTAHDRITAGERRAAEIAAAMRAVLARGRQLRVDYVAVTDTERLQPLVRAEGRMLVAVAAWVGVTRLIDNLVLDVQGDLVCESNLDD